ncbi:MAG: hypothetical protein WCK01_04960 [Candidatus Uhrbacteria bacterium]
MTRIYRIIAILIAWGSAIALICFVLAPHFPLNGIVRFSFPFDGASPWFNPFQPGERVSSPGLQPDGWTGQRITDEPVYGSARVPGAFDQVHIGMDIRPMRQPLADMGLLRDPEAFQFEMKPLWSEALSKGWHAVSLNGLRGVVRDGYPDESILRQDYDRLMTWDASATSPLLSDTAGVLQRFEISLRGQHDFYVVPVDGHVKFTFEIQDVNRSTDAKNTAAFRLMRDDEVLRTEAVSISGSSDTKPSEILTQTISADALAPGVYRLSFLADDDFFIRSISTDAKHWVIGPRLYLGDTVGYAGTSGPATVWSNSLHMSVDTFHNEGLQKVSLGSAVIYVQKTHTVYPLSRITDEGQGLREVKTEKGSVRLLGDGFFALDREAAFFPRPRRLTPEADPTGEGIVAVITPYIPAQDLGDGWWHVEASWAISSATEALKFSLGLPGIVTRNGAYDIRRMNVEYRRPPLTSVEFWRTIRRELSSAWHRL